MNPRLFHQIATKINCDIRTQNGVTADQVAAVASGVERTVSHPRIAEIMSELRKKGINV